MTSDAQKKKGYLLPDEIDGYDLLCVELMIPNNLEYIAAFNGQMWALATWYNWEKSYTFGDNRATLAAQYWTRLLDTYLCVKFNHPIEDDNMACCDDDNKIYRFTDGGILESSTDGGATWEPDPGDDPRINAPLFMPLPGADGSVKRCVAANNATGQIKAQADQMGADIAAWGGISLLVSAILGILAFLSILGSGGLLTPLVVGLAGTLLTAGRAAFVAAMTNAVYEELCCALYCNMQPDGSFTAGDIADIKIRLGDELSGVALSYLLGVVDLLGTTGLTNAGRTSSSDFDFDCTLCDCNITCVGVAAVIMGTIVEQTDTYITLQAEFGTWNGIEGWYCIYGSMVDDFCCLMCQWQVLAGGLSAGSLVDCDGNLNNGLPDYKRRAEFRGTSAAFVIKYRFDPEGVGC